MVVLAATAAPSGSGGDFTVTPFSDANEWVTGASSGTYSYSYPVQVPPVPGGFEPAVKLNYSSQTTDGLTSSTNNEASWVGDGWDYSPGFIEQEVLACGHDPVFHTTGHTGDLCDYTSVNTDDTPAMTLSLDGTQTPIVLGSGGWRAEADGGATFTQQNGYWVGTQRDGSKYYFGLNQLPGYSPGSPQTNSAWQVPVWKLSGLSSGSWVTQTWRWNLDYVTDRHGNAIAYFYNPKANWYAQAQSSTGTGQYTRGGTLAKITYGFQDGHAYDQTPPAQVTFTTVGGRQDAPTDLACAQGQSCQVNSPTFWNDQQLSTIATQALAGGSLQPADSWQLAQTFPATNDPLTAPSLWLSSITRTGQDGATPITLPPTQFAGTAMPNRMMTSAGTTAGYSPMTRFRLSSITNPTGAVTAIKYTATASNTRYRNQFTETRFQAPQPSELSLL